jgi:LCP family protein required for cell wall assembly
MTARGAAPAGRRRARRPRRTRGLAGTLGVTALSTALPGTGLLWSGRRVVALLLLVPFLVAVGVAGWYVLRDPQAAVGLALDPQRLTLVTTVALAVLLVWVASVVTTYLLVRHRNGRRGHGLIGGAFVLLMCLTVAAPLGLVARYSTVQKEVVHKVFEGNRTATSPVKVTEEDPWGGRDRVNVLLLGGDGNVHREGIRTDSVVLVSMDVHTGRTVLFSLPRNLMDVPFPRRSRLADIYPDGFQGPGDPAEWLLNAVYRNVPALHPGVLDASDNEGADAVKLAVQGALGVPVDYYLLVNLAGFRRIVQAIGGVTVNINEPIPVGGNTDLGIPPDSYLQPGPDRRLDGFQALWFARGRYGSDDYQRMERQRCMIDAIINEAKPLNLLRRYESLAAVGQEIVRTDIPQELLAAFVDLAGAVKGGQVRSVVFRASDQFSPSNPDYAWVHQKVRRALHPKTVGAGGPPGPSDTPSDTPSDGPSVDPADAVDAADSCAYRPGS